MKSRPFLFIIMAACVVILIVGAGPFDTLLPAPAARVASASGMFRKPRLEVVASDLKSHEPPPSSPGNWREQFARDLLAGLGNTNPTPDTIRFVVLWTIAEDGSDGPGSARERHNPLNTTMPASGAWEINSVGVKGYPSHEIGMEATLQTIANGYYPHVVSGLKTNNVEEALSGIDLDTWGTGTDNVRTLLGR